MINSNDNTVKVSDKMTDFLLEASENNKNFIQKVESIVDLLEIIIETQKNK